MIGFVLHGEEPNHSKQKDGEYGRLHVLVKQVALLRKIPKENRMRESRRGITATYQGGYCQPKHTVSVKTSATSCAESGHVHSGPPAQSSSTRDQDAREREVQARCVSHDTVQTPYRQPQRDTGDGKTQPNPQPTHYDSHACNTRKSNDKKATPNTQQNTHKKKVDNTALL